MAEDTSVSVRSVDLRTWKEFQKAIIDKYGNLYGYLGPEVTKALQLWLNDRVGDKPSVGTRAKEMPTKRHAAWALGTNAAKIEDAMNELGGEATIQQVISYLNHKHGNVNASSISTDMSDLALNGPPSSLYPMSKRILKRVSRGRFRLLQQGGAEK